ncbi:tyrosine-protein phosphatase [Streptomyces vinaceus]|uniref:tyrosine-protein phosphatase n=1 Tax=Streptomyces vinaceus TaxID=1960 RepID=UPI00368D6FB5
MRRRAHGVRDAPDRGRTDARAQALAEVGHPGVQPHTEGPQLSDQNAAVSTTPHRRHIELIAAGPGPAVFHCTSGKDRTGLIAAFALLLLDVSEEEVLADFALTEQATTRLTADWHAAHPGRTMRWPSYGRAPARILSLVLADLTARYGSPAGYLSGRVGITPATTARLRERLLR